MYFSTAGVVIISKHW